MKFSVLISSLFAVTSAEKFLVKVQGEDIDNVSHRYGGANPYIKVFFDGNLVHTSQAVTRYDFRNDHENPEFEFRSAHGQVPQNNYRIEMWDKRFGDRLCHFELPMTSYVPWKNYRMDCRMWVGDAEFYVSKLNH